MAKKFNGPAWKAQVEQMSRQGEEMAKKFNSPEWKAQMEQIQKSMQDQTWILKDTANGVEIYKPEKKVKDKKDKKTTPVKKEDQ